MVFPHLASVQINKRKPEIKLKQVLPTHLIDSFVYCLEWVNNNVLLNFMSPFLEEFSLEEDLQQFSLEDQEQKTTSGDLL